VSRKRSFAHRPLFTGMLLLFGNAPVLTVIVYTIIESKLELLDA
jgi:hypothetical protein